MPAPYQRLRALRHPPIWVRAARVVGDFAYARMGYSSRGTPWEIFGPFATSSAARRDAVRVTASLDPALTLRAAPAIEAFDNPSCSCGVPPTGCSPRSRPAT